MNVPLILLAVAALVLPAWVASAERSSDIGSGKEMEAEYSTASVILDGRLLFHVRGVSAYPADQRATRIVARLVEVAGDETISVNALHVVEEKDRSTILAGDRLLVRVFDADAKIEGVDRQPLAQVYKDKIAEAIQTYRHERSPRVLLFDTVIVLGATLVLALLLTGMRRAFRWVDALSERRLKARIQGLQIQFLRIVEAEQLWAGWQKALRTVHIVAIAAVCLAYAEIALSVYPWTRPLAQRLFTILLDPVRTMGLAILDAVPDLAFLAILVIVTRYALRMTRLFFVGVEHGTVKISGFDREWASPTYRIIRMLVIAFAVVIAYPYVPGSQSEAFKGVSIFLGVIFSLGSSSAIANIIAGYTMTYRRAFRVGDRIQVAELVGDVMEMRLLVTHLRSLKNEEIVVPNSLILNSHVINYSSLARRQGLILHTTVGIGYETPWRQVEAMLLLAAERTPGLLREPQPFVSQKELGDFCVKYELNAYCDHPQDSHTLYTALHRNILDAFNEYGVQIMTPAYEGDPDRPKVVPQGQWFEPPADPNRLPLHPQK